MRWATPCFMTRADFTTCGRNILPAPNRSPTMFMPSMSGPSMTCSGRPPLASTFWYISSVSATMWSVRPCTSACARRCSTGSARHSFLRPSSLAAPLALSAISTRRSPASGRRFSTTSSTRSRNCGSTSSYTPTMPALTMPMSMPALMAWYRNTVWIASRTGSLPRKEKLTLETPPLTFAPGRFSLIHLVDQDAVGARADLGLALVGVGLALLVEGHHHGGGAIALDQRGLALELRLAFLHADG